jgi:hypothetical protein
MYVIKDSAGSMLVAKKNGVLITFKYFQAANATCSLWVRNKVIGPHSTVVPYESEETDPYLKAGHADREAYLASLAIEYNVHPADVASLAELLGPSEDFDGLISDLEDFSSFII